ncbi:hypothetical protein SLS62_008072 [Diatrype stigma]|uniref:Spindle pole body component n=1 Tax=Diatrype stigma TaxID=117547 RepID=A0AAN9UY71_9PEZI
MAGEDPADVFAFPDYEKPSKWLNLTPSSNQENLFFALDIPKTGPITNPANNDATAELPQPEEHGFFKLPPLLEPFGLDGDQQPDQSHGPILEPLHDTKLPDLDVFDEDWLQDIQHPAPASEFKTWEGFLVTEIPESKPLFITEAGPEVYDAAMSLPDDPLSLGNTDRKVMQTNPFVAALLALALGRGSVFFIWDEKTASFIPNLDKMRISGFSSEILQGVLDSCLQCGTITRSLSNYVRVIYKTYPSPVRVSLAKAVDTVLLVVQTKLGEKSRHIRSLLQLQSVIQPIQVILAYFKTLVTKVVRLKLDEHVLSTIFNETRTLEHVDKLLANIMREVLAQITEPWTDLAGKWIGTKDEEGVPLIKEEGLAKGFVKVGRISYMDDFGFEVEELDFIFDEDRMPNFIPVEVASIMFEAGKTLRLLRTYHPEHPLCRASLIMSSKPPALRWQFDWETIKQLQEDVASYETSVTQKLRQLCSATSDELEIIGQHRLDDGYHLELFGHDGAKLEATLLASMNALDQPPDNYNKEDSLSRLLHNELLGNAYVPDLEVVEFSPHWSVIPIQSFGPLVAAQARLINREYMKLVFGTHRLRDHLAVQKQFQLLGNGMFCSRLSHALFDPELETAERYAGVARQGGTMGLRLSGRDTWPPASSELRLALMGVLTESYLPPSTATAELDAEKQGLPSDVSFAVRDLSPEEIDRCMNPGSLEALDFLRLSYKPPAPLSPIISPIILIKYDRIFKLLLRILRMLYVVGQISRDIVARTSRWDHVDNVSLRFNFEAQHFVTSISTYFLDTGIEMPWLRFQSWLDEVEADLDRHVSKPHEARIVSPSELRAEHERMLDHMMHTLLLRRRQQAVMKLLEDIFTSILQFSKRTRLASLGRDADADGARGPSSRELYGVFKKKVGVFLTVCRGLSEKGGHAVDATTKNETTSNNERQPKAAREENTIDRLLMKLEMSGYYSQTRF